MLVCRQEMEKMLVITNRLSGLDGIAFDTTMGKCGRENAIGRNKKNGHRIAKIVWGCVRVRYYVLMLYY
jgi:hypothetical protein